MHRFPWVRWLVIPALVGLAGCAENSMLVRGQLETLQRQQLALARQMEEYQSRAGSLDRDNQQLQSLLARAGQQSKVGDDHVATLQKQLSDLTTQLARLREEKAASEKQVQTLTASLQRQGGVSITPNNSYLKDLPAASLPGVLVRRDGDVVRIELPADQLFDPGTARLKSGAQALITAVAAEVGRTYPDQMIGVEGFTSSDPVPYGPWRNHSQLSVSWAAAVHDVLVTQTRLRPDQLFISGHGANHPILSNGMAAGKQRNQRVELVVYPERRRN